MSSLSFLEKTYLNWSVLSVDGQIDSKTVGEFKEALDQKLLTSKCLAIDFTLVRFMSSAGLRALLVLHHQTSSQGLSLVFVGINEDIQDVMRVTGFHQHFTLVSSLDELQPAVQ